MKSSPWSPLRHRIFRLIWLAGLASNIGTTMHDVGAAWLMASLAPSAFLVALMQTASSLPIFLVALPAGALADLVDRRRLLIITQAWMLASALLLGILTLLHVTTPQILLVLTFSLGIGGALSNPAWQAVTPELVPRDELPASITLGGAGYNIARAVGPALGGLIVAAAGSWAVFLLNSLSFMGIIFVLYGWRRDAEHSNAPNERLMGAIRAGGRYVRHSPALRAVLVRTGVFISCASGLWALLPFLGSVELKLSSAAYGALLACFGLGAVTASLAMPRLMPRYSVDRIMAGSTLVFAAASAGLAATHFLPVLYFVLACGGGAWMIVMSTMNLMAQLVVPSWVRARALAIYLLVIQGGLALGSMFWGTVATRFNIHVALYAAAGGLILGLGVVPRYRLGVHESPDLDPSQHWPLPVVENEPDLEDGPVLVTIEYDIDPEQAEGFRRAMRPVGVARRRNGAYRWSLFRDVGEPRRFIENFVVESWGEHLRQHERITESDRLIEQHAYAFHQGVGKPFVSHLVSAYASGSAPRTDSLATVPSAHPTSGEPIEQNLELAGVASNGNDSEAEESAHN